jgi:hypothetical protein
MVAGKLVVLREQITEDLLAGSDFNLYANYSEDSDCESVVISDNSGSENILEAKDYVQHPRVGSFSRKIRLCLSYSDIFMVGETVYVNDAKYSQDIPLYCIIIFIQVCGLV